jgi:D-serine deaminase-like pyridoxal phosphate-dependent protein
VGPAIERLVALARRAPRVRVGCIVDNAATADVLDLFAERQGASLVVYVDLDVGMGRTGIASGPTADDLYRRIARSRWLETGGIHAYDGHSTARDPASRCVQAADARGLAFSMRRRMLAEGLAVPEVVLGGTPAFACHAAALSEADPVDRAAIRLSPGTYGYYDWGYASNFADLPFHAAALVFGRVISVPAPGRFTIDVGSKAIAADPEQPRGLLLNVDGAVAGPQSEEHWVFTIEPGRTPAVGAAVFVWPKHICPTVEHHDRVAVIGPDRRLETWWPVTARGRS